MEERVSENVGTVGDIEDAHRALDEAGIDPGPLAIRTWKAAALVKKYNREKLAKNIKFYTVDI